MNITIKDGYARKRLSLCLARYTHKVSVSVIDEYWDFLVENQLGLWMVQWLDEDSAEARKDLLIDIHEAHLTLAQRTQQWWYAVQLAIEISPLPFALLFEEFDNIIQRNEHTAWRQWVDGDYAHADALEYARRYLENRDQLMDLVGKTRKWRETVDHD